jgi:hypothetical protein
VKGSILIDSGHRAGMSEGAEGKCCIDKHVCGDVSHHARDHDVHDGVDRFTLVSTDDGGQCGFEMP